MSNKKPLPEQIEGFLDIWDLDALLGLMGILAELFVLYDVDEADDWLKKEVEAPDVNNVRLVRTVYLISRLGEFYAGKLCRSNVAYKDLWRKIEEFQQSSEE